MPGPGFAALANKEPWISLVVVAGSIVFSAGFVFTGLGTRSTAVGIILGTAIGRGVQFWRRKRREKIATAASL